VGVSYFKDNFYFEYFDEIEGETYKQLEGLIPNAHYVTITSRSRDGNTLVARNLGPRDPGTYYLLHEGELKSVGSRQPLLESEKLADVEYMQYKARDGRELAMFVTIPNGEGPFPTVVMPHGGPHVQEIVIYDEWAQMLANNGYMVVQPQYRMSHGYGKELFLSAFIDGSEAGRKMQDDKDDAALRLVELGLADPDRMAMFGWSYGGYAALIAASRTPQIYQCTIAGAAISDTVVAANDEIRRSPDGAMRVWRDVYEYGAVQPVKEVEKVNVPVLLIHGSVDSRVLPKQAKLYRDAMDKADKYYKYVELEGADHFYVTLWYEHQIELYESIIDFLENDCGQMSLRES
jgi:dipeptidyl aminopeptidase/acylaminoacyl peptidase